MEKEENQNIASADQNQDKIKETEQKVQDELKSAETESTDDKAE